MLNKILATCIILFLILGGFFAVYLRESHKESKPLLIGIMGESRSDGSSDLSYNEEVLGKLLNVLKRRGVDVIFFTGNLTVGWSKLGLANGLIAQGNGPKPKVDMYGNDWAAKGFGFSSSIFRNQLKEFYHFVQRNFDDHVSIYPLMGNHEAIGPGTSTIFREEFHINQSTPLTGEGFGYTVSIGDAFFALIPTNYYDPENGQLVEHTVGKDTLEWLKKVLKQASSSHRYLFVMGHEAAYSSPSIFNQVSGLDNHPKQRDAFWKVLKSYHVLAYFASHEHLYDRSNRMGIWQIVSGGGGSPLNEGGESNNAFFHCLLLTIPPDGEGAPTVTVLDEEGEVRDTFKLENGQQPLHQFRISKRAL